MRDESSLTENDLHAISVAESVVGQALRSDTLDEDTLASLERLRSALGDLPLIRYGASFGLSIELRERDADRGGMMAINVHLSEARFELSRPSSKWTAETGSDWSVETIYSAELGLGGSRLDPHACSSFVEDARELVQLGARVSCSDEIDLDEGPSEVDDESRLKESEPSSSDSLNRVKQFLPSHEFMVAGIALARSSLEAGNVDYSAYVAHMVGELGADARLYCRSWYEALRHDPLFDSSHMTSAAEIDARSRSGVRGT